MWGKKLLDVVATGNTDIFLAPNNPENDNRKEKQKDKVKEIKFQVPDNIHKDGKSSSVDSMRNKISLISEKAVERNLLVFDNVLLNDKSTHGYVDSHRIIDNLKDIKSIISKQKQERNILRRNYDSVIDEEDENEEIGISVCIQKAKNQYLKGQVDSAVMYLKVAINYGNKELKRSINNPVIEKLIMNAYLLISQCYLLQGKPKISLQMVGKVLKDHKNNTPALYVKAESYYYISKFEKALMYYHQGIRTRNFLYSDQFRMGIAKSRDAINKCLKILDNVSETFAQKSILRSSFKNQAGVIKEMYRYKYKNANQGKMRKTVVITSKRAKLKQSIPQTSSKICINRVIPKKKGAPLDPDIKRLQMEHNFLDDVLQSINIKKDTQNQNHYRKRNSINPQDIHKYINETLIYIDKRKAFWTSVSSNKSLQYNSNKNKNNQRYV